LSLPFEQREVISEASGGTRPANLAVTCGAFPPEGYAHLLILSRSSTLCR
jgi:hypothetical protein